MGETESAPRFCVLASAARGARHPAVLDTDRDVQVCGRAAVLRPARGHPPRRPAPTVRAPYAGGPTLPKRPSYAHIGGLLRSVSSDPCLV